MRVELPLIILHMTKEMQALSVATQAAMMVVTQAVTIIACVLRVMAQANVAFAMAAA